MGRAEEIAQLAQTLASGNGAAAICGLRYDLRRERIPQLEALLAAARRQGFGMISL